MTSKQERVLRAAWVMMRMYLYEVVGTTICDTGTTLRIERSSIEAKLLDETGPMDRLAQDIRYQIGCGEWDGSLIDALSFLPTDYMVAIYFTEGVSDAFRDAATENPYWQDAIKGLGRGKAVRDQYRSLQELARETRYHAPRMRDQDGDYMYNTYSDMLEGEDVPHLFHPWLPVGVEQ